VSGLLGGLFSTAKSLFGFESGGVMTSHGPLPLHRYASGGIATSPQLALFGEGRTPEAYVPLPDNRGIPVVMKMAATGNRQPAGARVGPENRRSGAASPPATVNLHISTPDRRSFEASEAQLTSMLTRMLARGARYA
jgi:hypothetical protein